MSASAVYPCRYLPGGVDCGVHGGGECKRCGWNPKTTELRKRRIREHPFFAVMELCDDCLDHTAHEFVTVRLDDYARKETICDYCLKKKRCGTYTVRYDMSAKEDGDFA